jgi:hypothetical protein
MNLSFKLKAFLGYKFFFIVYQSKETVDEIGIVFGDIITS